MLWIVHVTLYVQYIWIKSFFFFMFKKSLTKCCDICYTSRTQFHFKGQKVWNKYDVDLLYISSFFRIYNPKPIQPTHERVFWQNQLNYYIPKFIQKYFFILLQYCYIKHNITTTILWMGIYIYWNVFICWCNCFENMKLYYNHICKTFTI